MPPDPVTAAVADAAAGLPDATVTVADSGCVVVRFPDGSAFYVTVAASR